MKKFLITTCAILMMSVTANACGGITVKGNSGATYCLSKHDMNWYSAYAWCHDQGMKLIDLDSVCKNYNSCPELALSSAEKANITSNGGALEYIWLNDSYNSSIVIFTELTVGKVYTGFGTATRNAKHFTLCF